MGKIKNRLRAQRKFAQGAYIPSINPSTNGTSVPLMNASHKAFNTPGPIIINQSSARDIFTKMTLGRVHSHSDWEVHYKYDSGTQSNLPESNSKKKLKERKMNKANFKKKYILRNNQKSTTPNRRRVSVTTDSESDTPLSCLSIKNVEHKLQEKCAQSAQDIQKGNRRRSRNTILKPDFSYFSETPPVNGCSPYDKRNIDKPYSVSGVVASDYTAKTRKKLKKRKVFYKDKPKVPENIAPDQKLRPKCPAPHNTVEKKPATSALSSNESSSMPLEESYDNTADWVRNHHQSSIENTNANHDNGPTAFTDQPQKETDPLITNDAFTVNTNEKVSDQFKIPDLPVRFTKNSSSSNSPTQNMEEAPEETPRRRLRSSKESPFSGLHSASSRPNTWGPHTQKAKMVPARQADLNQAVEADLNQTVEADMKQVVEADMKQIGKADMNQQAVEADLDQVVEADMNQANEANMDQADEADVNQANESNLNKTDEADTNQADEAKMDQADKVDLNQVGKADMNQADEANMDQADKVDVNQVGKANMNQADEANMDQADEADINQAVEADSKQVTSAVRPTIPAPLDATSDSRRMVLCLTPLEKTVYHRPSQKIEKEKSKQSQQNLNPVVQIYLTPNAHKTYRPLDVEKTTGLKEKKTTQLAEILTVRGPSTSGNQQHWLEITPLVPKFTDIPNTPYQHSDSSLNQLNETKTTSMKSQNLAEASTLARRHKAVVEANELYFDFPLDYPKPRMSENLPPITPSVSAGIISSETLLVFRPTPQEFKDPMVYIEKIQEKAKRFGICKIIPPKGFNVPSHLDDSVKFTTVSQYLGRLYHRWGPTSRELTFIQTYVTMLVTAREREQFSKAPLFEGVEVDLVKLYHVVLEQGGIENMFTDSDNWIKVAEKMGFGFKPDYKKLEKLYCKHVLPYESLSQQDRLKIQAMVDKVWAERARNMMRRVQRPLHYQYQLLGEAISEDEEELQLDPDTEEVRVAGKHCFDRIEECTGKGRPTNLANYRRISDRIKQMRFANRPRPTTQDIEDEYWDIVTLGTEHTSVLSGFIDTSVKNLGHPTDPEEPGGSHPWNLKRLTENPDNILSSLGKSLSVTVPTLCLNQLFSTNCWHMDPHQLSWMDYMHEGRTKIWYAVSEKDSTNFRRAMQTLVPSVVQQKGIWLASDTTMVPPSQLVTHGVQLQRVEQNVGEYIVVFAGAYASSIATGLTISESIYFENKNFLSRIDSTFLQMHLDCEPAMFSNTMLLMRIANNPEVNTSVLPRVYTLLKRIIVEEVEARRQARLCNCDIKLTPGRIDTSHWPLSWPYQEECAICRAPLILSKSIRFDEPRSLLCLKHALRIYNCAPVENRGPPPPVTLLYSMEDLNEHMEELEERLRATTFPQTLADVAS